MTLQRMKLASWLVLETDGFVIKKIKYSIKALFYKLSLKVDTNKCFFFLPNTGEVFSE